MSTDLSRRDFLKTVGAAGIAGTLIAVDLRGGSDPNMTAVADANEKGKVGESFYFVQMSDTHWGFNKPAINADYAGTLKKAIAGVNALNPQPDFIMFTGDLTQTTDDDKQRRERMKEFAEIIKGLKVQNIKFIPGEHDASLDNGEAFKEFFGKTHYTFEHKGVHFITLDNVSDPRAQLGAEQLQWLADDLKNVSKDARIVVFTHRPLFDLAADWDWNTRDGAQAIELLQPYKNVVVLYGHIHQVNDHTTGHIGHHSAMGLMWPLPAPHSVPKKAPVPWDKDHPYKGLGYRQVQATIEPVDYKLMELPVTAKKETAADAPVVIKITAKKFEYSPKEITLKRGVPAVLELTSLDRLHGFNCPGLGIRSDIEPGKVNKVSVTPDKAGTFDFHCDIFCGSGHEGMAGTITVTE